MFYSHQYIQSDRNSINKLYFPLSALLAKLTNLESHISSLASLLLYY